jgi:two-component system sensor histidine kinase MtrB
MTVARPRDVGTGTVPGGPASGAEPPGPEPMAAAAAPSAHSVRHRAQERAYTAGRMAIRAGAWTRSRWQRSLQLRVAATTLVVSGIVVLIVGLFIVNQVADGVLGAKRDAAIRQATVGLAYAKTVFVGVDVTDANDIARAQDLLLAAQSGGGSGAGLFSIVVIAGTDSPADSAAKGIPFALRTIVEQQNQAVQYAPISTGPQSAATPGLIVGDPVQARSGLIELYYLFPLTAERQTISLLQRTVLLGGLGLVLLVVAIAMLVTRQVVRPVRVAAQTAGRLAAGDLSQRISVRGSDDIARLGRSFNDMAGSLQRQIRRLEDLSRLQRRFTSDVSHELRTPLTTIRMASELLHGAREEFPPELSRSAELLQAELDRFEALLGDLLEISRYDAGVANLEAETVDIRGVVASTVESCRILARRHGSDLVVHLPDAPVSVEIDTRRVERILRNLLANALDHGEGRPVVLSIGYDDDAVAVTVRDSGVGLRPGEAGLVFNRFWRGDPSRSRLTGGTGLGLAISLEDARLHDGWLQAWGERGHGAQFRLTLPRRAGHTLLSSPLPLRPDDEDDEE